MAVRDGTVGLTASFPTGMYLGLGLGTVALALIVFGLECSGLVNITAYSYCSQPLLRFSV